MRSESKSKWPRIGLNLPHYDRHDNIFSSDEVLDSEKLHDMGQPPNRMIHVMIKNVGKGAKRVITGHRITGADVSDLEFLLRQKLELQVAAVQLIGLVLEKRDLEVIHQPPRAFITVVLKAEKHSGAEKNVTSKIRRLSYSPPENLDERSEALG